MPVKLPENTPAIAPVPIIVGELRVLLVKYCSEVNWTILLFVISVIFVAVVAFPLMLPWIVSENIFVPSIVWLPVV